jgi:hypothetical protein
MAIGKENKKMCAPSKLIEKKWEREKNVKEHHA